MDETHAARRTRSRCGRDCRGAVFAAGVRAPQPVDAMAMIYMIVTLIRLLIALRFVNPTELVSRVKEHPQAAA